jgi:hypothetical protein
VSLNNKSRKLLNAALAANVHRCTIAHPFQFPWHSSWVELCLNQNKNRKNFMKTFRAIPTLRLFVAAAAVLMTSTCGQLLRAAAVPVLNPSFEAPTVPGGFPAFPVIDSWQKTPDPGFPLPGGFTWNDLAGVFPNSAPGAADHIDNMDGSQAAYLISIPGVGFTQDLGVSYGVGVSYNLTLGAVGGGGGMPEGGSLLLGLFYRDAANNIVTIGGAPITFTAATFPTTTHFLDFTFTLPTVQAGDAWAGHNIGLEVLCTSGTGAGYWDVDNLRFQAVPEPSTVMLLGLGMGGMVLMGLRRRRRA